MRRLANLQISSNHVSNLIDKTIEDMRNGTGTTLYDLAGVISSCAEAQDDPILHVLPHAIGGYGQELIGARSLVSLPVLPDPIRNRLQAMITTSVDEGVSSLKIVKEQLCSDNEVDYRKLMKAAGMLLKQATMLAKQQRTMMPRSARMASPLPTEE